MVVFTVKALWKCFSSPNGSNMTWESSKSNLKVKRNESYDVQPNMRITYSDTVKKKWKCAICLKYISVCGKQMYQNDTVNS